MSKIAKKLELAVLNSNWQDVCDAYELITGKKIYPKVTTPTEKPLDKLNKKELYSLLKKSEAITFDLKPISEYDFDDLKILYDSSIKEFFFKENKSDTEETEIQESNIYFSNSSNELPEDNQNYSPQPQHTYISKKNQHKVLNCDKQPIRFVLKDFDTYGDEPAPKVKQTRVNASMVQAKCRRCGKTARVNKAILIRGTNENERIYICGACSG
jgi:hypothetical protein